MLQNQLGVNNFFNTVKMQGLPLCLLLFTTGVSATTLPLAANGCSPVAEKKTLEHWKDQIQDKARGQKWHRHWFDVWNGYLYAKFMCLEMQFGGFWRMNKFIAVI